MTVEQVLDRWVAPGGLGFKVKVGDRTYLLEYDQSRDAWEAGLLKP